MYAQHPYEYKYPPATGQDLWTSKCKKDPCEKKCCRIAPPDPCRRNCCDTLKARRRATAQARANHTKMREQYAAAFRHPVPKYALPRKPTAGKGQGCGAPPRRTLPPLWMYGLGTQRPKETVPAREITRRHRKYDARDRFNYADEIGTHRMYIQS